jgi:hypothetical protein
MPHTVLRARVGRRLSFGGQAGACPSKPLAGRLIIGEQIPAMWRGTVLRARAWRRPSFAGKGELAPPFAMDVG